MYTLKNKKAARFCAALMKGGPGYFAGSGLISCRARIASTV